MFEKITKRVVPITLSSFGAGLLFASVLSGAPAPDQVICSDIFGCDGGDAKCAEFRVKWGTQWLSGTCYEDIEPE